MSSLWFKGEDRKEAMLGSWHSRGFFCFVYVFILSKNLPNIGPSLLHLYVLKVCLQTIWEKDAPALQGNAFGIHCHWPKLKMSRCSIRLERCDRMCTSPGTHSELHCFFLCDPEEVSALIWVPASSSGNRKLVFSAYLPSPAGVRTRSLEVLQDTLPSLWCYVIITQWLMHTHEKLCRPFCINFNFLFLLACDDECTGVLLSDLDNTDDTILSVNLTGMFPAPYGILSNLENTTKYLRVGTGNAAMDKKHVSLGDVELVCIVGVILPVLPPPLFPGCTAAGCPVFPWTWPGTSLANASLFYCGTAFIV